MAQHKEKLVRAFGGQTNKRIIVASTALGMGVNFGDVRYIINWGPARSLLDQLQEAGRAGRDGQLSHVIIIFHGHQLSECEGVKELVNADGCYRVAAYKKFDPCIQPMLPAHNCCSHCAHQCSDDCPEFPFEKEPPTKALPPMTRPVSEQEKEALYHALTERARRSQKSAGATALNIFSEELIQDIVSHCHCLFSIHDIKECLPVFSVFQSLKIIEVIQEVFTDIPNFDTTMDFFGTELDPFRFPGESTPGREYFVGYFDSSDDCSSEPEVIDD